MTNHANTSIFKRRLLAATALTFAAMGATPAFAAPALPTGGQVQAGTAVIGSPSGSSITINQSSNRAIINWSDFSIGDGASVQINNGSGATLNRVTGSSVSQIDGLLSSTGSVYVINPNGVIIGKTGVVNVGGTFAASSLDVANSNFIAGGSLIFSGTSKAVVVNYGKIGSLGGDVALIAANVTNAGQITAAKGDVGLAAGTTVLLRDQLLNDGKFVVRVGGAGTSATNSGTIQAAEVELRANGGNIYALAGNTASIIKATGVSSNDGRVFLIAEGGTTTASGAIDATKADGKGGQVETSGVSVNLAGLTVKAGSWLIDPHDLTIDAAAATTINSSLAAGTNVALKTTASGASGAGVQSSSGAGDITVANALSWGTTATLTLDAYHGVNILAPITVSGAGGVVIKTNNGGTGGDYSFGLTSTGFSGSLNFTGTPNSGQSLNINGQAYTLVYSMAQLDAIDGQNGVDGSAVTAYGPGFTGSYALANNLDANGLAYKYSPVNLSVAGNATAYANSVFEGLGHTVSNLTINTTSTIPKITGSLTSIDSATGLFSMTAGGNAIRDIGVSGGNISGNSYVGGVVGLNQEGGTLKNVFSTATVFGSYRTGGLAGFSSATIVNAYATGPVTGVSETGGLVGHLDYSGTTTNAFAMGAVTGQDYTGGLVGYSWWQPVSNVYSTGFVKGSGSNTGGLFGWIGGGSSVTNGYWDTQTSGQSTSAAGTGLTTAQLQGTLPAGFDPGVWGTGPGLYPYLKSFYQTTPQAISGYAYSSGTTPAQGAQVGVYVGGKLLTGGTASTGANGYYYELVRAGTVTGTTKLGEALTLAGASTVSGQIYTDRPVLTSGNVSGVNVTSGQISELTNDTSLSNLNSSLAATFGSGYTAIASQLGGAATTIKARNAAGFNLNQALNLSGNYTVQTSAGDITVSAPISWSGAYTLKLNSYRNVNILAPLNVTSGGGMVIQTNSGG